jgi:hypothetical protein
MKKIGNLTIKWKQHDKTFEELRTV